MNRRAAGYLTLVTLAFILSSCGTNSNNSKEVTTSATELSNSSTSLATNVCPPADGSAARQTTFASRPPTCIDASRRYTATMETDLGTITIELDATKAPITVNNFVYLSRYHFYDGLTFHRVVKNFVVQGGDPQGTGLGGPGYQFFDELPKSASEYKEGSLAMANSGPNTNGSQFFIVLSASGASSLTPAYSLFGQVTQGLDVLHKIEADGSTSSSGTPVVLHKMNKVTISEQ